ncbi:MAG TPA: hypothetical protein PLA18_10255 [Deltaproteobacteria bacterium]|nr:hypothetical protein [Deltaproteobacteria bacterium]
MKKGRFFSSAVFMLLAAWLFMPAYASAKEVVQQWEVVNPAGVIKVTPIKMAPRIDSLEGKTIALKWNSKPNGNIFLDRVAELLKEKYPTAKVIKIYELEPTTVPQSANQEDSERKAKLIAKYKPDIVIGAQCD